MTTHWMVAWVSAALSADPVDLNALYARNGQALTSAGAQGKSSCPHMVRVDLAARVGGKAAVMLLGRSSGQAQFIE